MAELSQFLATEVDRVTSLSVAFDGNFSIDSVVTDVVPVISCLLLAIL